MRTAFGSNCSATATIVSLVCLLQGLDHHQFLFDDCYDDLADDGCCHRSDHADCSVRLGLQMIKAINTVKEKYPEADLAMRIGRMMVMVMLVLMVKVMLVLMLMVMLMGRIFVSLHYDF